MKKRFDKCPVCGSKQTNVVRPELMPHPYVGCGECSLYYQPTPVEKVYEAPHEVTGNLMSQSDKNVNNALAKEIVSFWKKHTEPYLEKGGFRYHLDIGTKYPYLGHCIQNHGKEEFFRSVGIDGIDLVGTFGEELGVDVLQTDFESSISEWEFPETFTKDFLFKETGHFSIVTLVHCVEHFYKPIQSLAKIHSLMKRDGILFIRAPDNETPGIERDFTEGHYLIHPLIWNLNSMLRALHVLGQTGPTFELMKTYSFHGQRDYWLRRL